MFSLHTTHTSGDCRGPRKIFDPLKMGVLIVVNYDVSSGYWTLGLWTNNLWPYLLSPLSNPYTILFQKGNVHIFSIIWLDLFWDRFSLHSSGWHVTLIDRQGWPWITKICLLCFLRTGMPSHTADFLFKPWQCFWCTKVYAFNKILSSFFPCSQCFCLQSRRISGMKVPPTVSL